MGQAAERGQKSSRCTGVADIQFRPGRRYSATLSYDFDGGFRLVYLHPESQHPQSVQHDPRVFAEKSVLDDGPALAEGRQDEGAIGDALRAGHPYRRIQVVPGLDGEILWQGGNNHYDLVHVWATHRGGAFARPGLGKTSKRSALTLPNGFGNIGGLSCFPRASFPVKTGSWQVLPDQQQDRVKAPYTLLGRIDSQGPA